MTTRRNRNDNMGNFFMGGSGVSDKTNNAMLNSIESGQGLPSERRPIRFVATWRTYLSVAAGGSISIQISDISQQQQAYTTAVRPIIQGWSYPYFMSQQGQINAGYAAIFQWVGIIIDPRVFDQYAWELLRQPGTLVISIAQNVFLNIPLDQSGAGPRWNVGYMSNMAANVPVPNTQLGSVSNMGDEMGGMQQLYLNDSVKGLTVKELETLQIVINMNDGWQNANVLTAWTVAPWFGVRAVGFLATPTGVN